MLADFLQRRNNYILVYSYYESLGKRLLDIGDLFLEMWHRRAEIASTYLTPGNIAHIFFDS